MTWNYANGLSAKELRVVSEKDFFHTLTNPTVHEHLLGELVHLVNQKKIQALPRILFNNKWNIYVRIKNRWFKIKISIWVCWLCPATDVNRSIFRWFKNKQQQKTVSTTSCFFLQGPLILFAWLVFWDGSVFGMNFSLDHSRDVIVFETLWINNVWAARLADYIETKMQEVSCGETLYIFLARRRLNCSNRLHRSEREALMLLKHCYVN